MLNSRCDRQERGNFFAAGKKLYDIVRSLAKDWESLNRKSFTFLSLVSIRSMS